MPTTSDIVDAPPCDTKFRVNLCFHHPLSNTCHYCCPVESESEKMGFFSFNGPVVATGRGLKVLFKEECGCDDNFMFSHSLFWRNV